MIPNETINDCLVENIFSSEIKGWIQPSITKSRLVGLNSTLINGIYAETPSVNSMLIKESENLWFFSQGWQKLETEADKDIENGLFKSFNSMDDFITDLEN